MRSIASQYDALILAHPKETTEAIRRLNEELNEKHVRFGDRVIPSFSKPYFMTEGETAELRRVLRCISRMLEKVVNAYFTHPELKPVFGLSRKEREYVEMDPGYGKNVVIQRPDGFMNQGRVHFIEFNSDSPAGSGYADVQERIFRELYFLKRLGRRYQWGRIRRLDHLLAALLHQWREFGPKRTPHIAIVDWKHLRTRHEFYITRDYFESRGYPTVVADPRELKFRSGRLWCGKFRVDLIYRRVIFRELWEKRREVGGFLTAYRKGKVCVVNSLRSKLSANKAVLSILTDPVYNYLFSQEEIRLRDRHIPWTRRVLDAKKFYGGRNEYVGELVDLHQERFVLKPSEGYGGRDVKIGRETSKSAWRMAIAQALRGGEHWVVQEYVEIPTMRVPVLVRGRVRLVSKKVNLNPFVFNGHYAGAMARLSDASIINVSAGGGLVPAITYRPKS